MQLNTYGNPENPMILLLHGTAITYERCFESIIDAWQQKFFLIVPAFSGHYPGNSSVFTSVEQETAEIEQWLLQQHYRKIHAAYGFSLGGTVLVNLLSKNTIQFEKVILDSAFCAPMGIMAGMMSSIMSSQLMRVIHGKGFHPVIRLLSGNKEDDTMNEMVYKNIQRATVKNAAMSCYQFTIPQCIASTTAYVTYWHGDKEPFSVKSARNLKAIIRHMDVKVFKNMGHGDLLMKNSQQFLSEFSQCLSSS